MHELNGFQLATYLCLTAAMERVILDLMSIGGGSFSMLNTKHRTVIEMLEMGVVERDPLQRWTAGRPGMWYQLTGLGKDLGKYLEQKRDPGGVYQILQQHGGGK